MPSANGSKPSTTGKVTVDELERKLFRERREKLGLKQRDLGKKVGASGGTISNMENGVHPQIKRETYARLRIVLLGDRSDPVDTVDDVYQDIVSDLPDLDRTKLVEIRALVKMMKESSKKPR